MLQRVLKQRSDIKQYHVASIVRDLAQLGFLCLQPAAAAEACEAAIAAANDAAAAIASANNAAGAAVAGAAAEVDVARPSSSSKASAAVVAGDVSPAAIATQCFDENARQAAGAAAATATASAAAAAVAVTDASPAWVCKQAPELDDPTQGSSSDGAANGQGKSTQRSSRGSSCDGAAPANTTNAQPYDPQAVTIKTAVTSAASVAYLARIYPQLQGAGLYSFYCELCSMYPGGVAFNFWPAAAAAAVPDELTGHDRGRLLQQRQQYPLQAQQQRQQTQETQRPFSSASAATRSTGASSSIQWGSSSIGGGSRRYGGCYTDTTGFPPAGGKCSSSWDACSSSGKGMSTTGKLTAAAATVAAAFAFILLLELLLMGFRAVPASSGAFRAPLPMPGG